MLKKALVDPDGTEERREATRGVLSKYGISRVCFRAMAHPGELPDITKSSW